MWLPSRMRVCVSSEQIKFGSSFCIPRVERSNTVPLSRHASGLYTTWSFCYCCRELPVSSTQLYQIIVSWDQTQLWYTVCTKHSLLWPLSSCDSLDTFFFLFKSCCLIEFHKNMTFILQNYSHFILEFNFPQLKLLYRNCWMVKDHFLVKYCLFHFKHVFWFIDAKYFQMRYCQKRCTWICLLIISNLLTRKCQACKHKIFAWYFFYEQYLEFNQM